MLDIAAAGTGAKYASAITVIVVVAVATLMAVSITGGVSIPGVAVVVSIEVFEHISRPGRYCLCCCL